MKEEDCHRELLNYYKSLIETSDKEYLEDCDETKETAKTKYDKELREGLKWITTILQQKTYKI